MDYRELYEKNKEKARKVGTIALHAGEFAAGAFGSGFVRERWGMPQIMGRDANLVLGLGAIALGIGFPNVMYSTDIMMVGMGALSEKLIAYGREAGKPSTTAHAGEVVAGYGHQLPAHDTSASAGLRHVMAAREAMAAGR